MSKYWKPSNISFTELVGAKVIEANEEMIVVEKNGKKYAIVADDPSGCMGTGGFCYPLLKMLANKENKVHE